MPLELVAVAPGQATLREYSEPPLQPDEVRIESILTAEKHGTTLAEFKGESPFAHKRWDEQRQLFMPAEEGRQRFPMRLGNLTVGRVVEVGAEVRSLQVGDRVYGYLPIRQTHTVKAHRVWPAPAEVSDEALVCVDPAAVALLAVREGRFSLGDAVAVFGLGAIGLMAVRLSRLAGAGLVVGIDPVPARRDLALAYGADATLDPRAGDVGLALRRLTGEAGVDVSLEVSGVYPALHQAIRGTRYGGTIVPVSFYHGDPAGLNLTEEWHFNRHVLVSGARVESEPYRDYPRWTRERVYATVIDLFRRGRLTVEGLLTEVSLAEAPAAFATLAQEPTRWIKLAVRYR